MIIFLFFGEISSLDPEASSAVDIDELLERLAGQSLRDGQRRHQGRKDGVVREISSANRLVLEQPNLL